MLNCKKLFIVFFTLFALVASARHCLAIPTQFGDSGLVTQPTAETLNSGNICVGIIANCAENDGKTATVLPVFMTLGLGSFLEAYGSYPNILFNGDEEASGRGYSNVGFKIRVFGKRSSQFKLGLDGQLRRTVSGNINYDGLTDQVFRAIASYSNGTFGLHGNAGYIKPESPQYISYEKQLVYGGGIEYLPNSRIRLLTEIGIESSKSQGLSDRAEVTAGFQYFLSPHLTLNIALAKGFTDESPDWRALFGFSSCQGIGTYQRPIPRKVAPQTEQPAEEKVEVKALKIRTLKPLSPKKKVVEPDKSSSKYEVPVGDQAEVVTLSPVSAVSSVDDVALAGGAAIAAAANAPLTISSGIPLLQVAPEMAGSVSATALALPLNDVSTLSTLRPARSYKLNEVVKTDDNQIVGKKIVEDLRYQAQFYSIAETPTAFSTTFIHKYDKPLDIWIEGADKSNVKLSQSKAAPYEEVTLTVNKINGKVPYFKLHIGELSEVFEFFPLRKAVKLGKIEIAIKPVVGGSIAPVSGSVAETASTAAPSTAAAVAAPVATTAPTSTNVLSSSKASAPAAATTVAATPPVTAPGAGSSAAIASVSAAPAVGSVAATLAASATAPQVGNVVVAGSDAVPRAGGAAAAPVATTAPTSTNVLSGTKASAPAAATTVAATPSVTAPGAGSSAAIASVSAAPAVGSVAASLAASAAAPQVGSVVVAGSDAVPNAGGAAAAPVATTAPTSTNVLSSSKASAPVAATTVVATPSVTAPGAGSSAAIASVSAVPVVGSVAATLAASATAPQVGNVSSVTSTATSPRAGAIPFTEAVASPKAGNTAGPGKVAGPTAGKLTGPVSVKTAPAAGLAAVAPEVATTPGGATVILLNSGSAPVPGEITKAETLTVRPPVSGSLAAVPTKTVQAVAHKKFRLPSTVIFAFDDATLTEEGKAAITDVVEAIRTEKRWYVLRVDGFTDNLGSDDYNIKLGLRRAISVASYMVTNNGIDPSILFVKSSGENDPIATNETEEGRSLNRRAEIILFVQKEE